MFSGKMSSFFSQKPNRQPFQNLKLKEKKFRMKPVVPLKLTSKRLSSLLETCPLTSFHAHSMERGQILPISGLSCLSPHKNKSSMKSEVSSGSLKMLRTCLPHCRPTILVEWTNLWALGTSGSKRVNKGDSLLFNRSRCHPLWNCVEFRELFSVTEI